jgi:hypothetical protein
MERRGLVVRNLVICLSLVAAAMSPAVGAGAAAQSAPAAGFSYAEYDRLTRKYIDEQGFVNYRELKKELPALRAFVEQLAAHGPANRPEWFASDEERKRYYLTAYNANVLLIAASAYPDRHALWSRIGLFKNHDIVLGGRKLSLNTLEHQILRKEYRDPRIHFYINCAAKSCPALERGAIPTGETEAALERAARRFLNDPRHTRFDAATQTLYLSKLFDWFEEDFIDFLKARGQARPSLADYALLHLNEETRAALAQVPAGKLRIRFLSYDKSLNEQ